MQIAPQRTGHNAGPLGSLDHVILLRTDRLRGVEIDPERRIARVLAGSRWEEVVPAASELGLAALHGSTPDVSVAGYTLGGGVGWYARKLGLAANSVTAIELVTADGRLRRADREHNPELFWALRGGGNFGVVTAVEFQLYDIPEVYAGTMFFPWERSAEVLRTWLGWTRTAPEEVTSVGRILQFPPLPEIPEPLRGQSFVVLELVFASDKAAGDELTEPLRALRPVMDTIGMVPPAGIAELHMDPRDPMPYVGHGQLLGTLDGQFMTFGVGVLAAPELGPLHRQALDRLAAAFAPYDTGREYLNFTEEHTDPARFYRPDAYHRLREVKAAYDPDNMFRANHPIPPSR
jgi:FAD/FMN-containing dehydrogenase